MIPICPNCELRHPVRTSIRPIGIFQKETKYVALFEGAPIRGSRERAEYDYCEWWNERRDKTALSVALLASLSEDETRFDHVALVQYGMTQIIAGAPQAFPVDVPSDDFDGLVSAFNDVSAVIVERASRIPIDAANGGPIVVPLLTIVGKK